MDCCLTFGNCSSTENSTSGTRALRHSCTLQSDHARLPSWRQPSSRISMDSKDLHSWRDRLRPWSRTHARHTQCQLWIRRTVRLPSLQRHFRQRENLSKWTYWPLHRRYVIPFLLYIFLISIITLLVCTVWLITSLYTYAQTPNFLIPGSQDLWACFPVHAEHVTMHRKQHLTDWVRLSQSSSTHVAERRSGERNFRNMFIMLLYVSVLVCTPVGVVAA